MKSFVGHPLHPRKYIVPESEKSFALPFQFSRFFHPQIYSHHRINWFLRNWRDFSNTCEKLSNKSDSRYKKNKKYWIIKVLYQTRETWKFSIPFTRLREHFSENPLFARAGDSFFAAIMRPSRFSSFDQGCAWIFDRRTSPQWEICTAKRITDVFVRLATMAGGKSTRADSLIRDESRNLSSDVPGMDVVESFAWRM